MRFKKTIFVLIICFVVALIGILIYKQNNSVETDNNTLSKEYEKLVKLIQEDFQIEGYEQIMKNNMDNIVVVPDSVAGRQDTPGGLYERHKNYVFKNKEEGVVVLLDITSNNLDLTKRIWTHSMGYTPSLFNSPDPDHKHHEYYDEIYTNAESSLYSFIGKGYNVSIMAISDNPKNIEVFTLSKAATFVDSLIEFMDKHGL